MSNPRREDSNITRNEPAGDAVAKALAAMERKCREIASRPPKAL